MRAPATGDHGRRSKIRVTFVLSLVALVTISAFAFIVSTSSERVEIDQICNPVGFWARIKANIRARTFWLEQEAMIDAEIARLSAAPAALRAEDLMLAEAMADVDAQMEQTYRDHPEYRPSPSKVTADRLRQLANDIEAAETRRLVEESMERRRVALEACLPTVRAAAR